MPIATVRDLLRLPRDQRRQLIRSLPRDAQEALLWYWPFWAREKQLPPPEPWTTWFLKGGRGFGKTRSGAEWIRHRVETGSRYLALIGQTPGDVRDVMIEGESGILAKSPPWDMPLYEPSKRRLTWPNGARATTFSGANPDELRGPQHDTIWADEIRAFKFARETWDNALLGLRLGNDPKALITTTPKPSLLLKEIQADPTTVTVTGTSYENRANLAPTFFSQIIRRYEGTRTGLQEIYAHDLDEAEGALWKRHYFVYRPMPEDLVRIVVAIDPALTSAETSDETGIIVAGRDNQGNLYVLADGSGRHTPHDWARRAIGLYREFQADRIIGEVNNGGDMIEETLRNVDRTISYASVHASRGKAIRAEPISALYQQGRVSHIRTFEELEDQCCGWEPGSGRSPDRMDALVWALSALTGPPEPHQEIVVFDAMGLVDSMDLQ